MLQAVKSNRAEEVRRLLARSPGSIHEIDSRGQYPLHIAAQEGYTDLVRLLIEHGAEVNAPDRFGWMALHAAASAGHLDVCEILLNAGATMTLTSDGGNTSPLHYVVRIRCSGDEDVAKLRAVIAAMLKNAPSYLDLQNQNGETALHQAAFRGRLESVRILLDHRASVDVPNKFGETALHFAARGQHPQVIQMLVEAGANIFTKGSFGSCLEVALSTGSKELAAFIERLMQEARERETQPPAPAASEDEDSSNDVSPPAVNIPPSSASEAMPVGSLENEFVMIPHDSSNEIHSAPTTPLQDSTTPSKADSADTLPSPRTRVTSMDIDERGVQLFREMMLNNGPCRLPPRRRRLRHVQAIYARNVFAPSAIPADPPNRRNRQLLLRLDGLDLFYTLHALTQNAAQSGCTTAGTVGVSTNTQHALLSSGSVGVATDDETDREPFYTSEVTSDTNNPTWNPIAGLSTHDVDTPVDVSTTNRFVIKVWQRCHDDSNAENTLLFVKLIDLSQLVFLGVERLNQLGRMPRNAVILLLHDGLYGGPEIVEHLRRTRTLRETLLAGPSAASTATPPSEAALRQLSDLANRVKAARKELVALREHIATRRLATMNEISAQRSARDMAALRVSRLRTTVSTLERELDQDRKNIGKFNAEVLPQARSLQRAEISLLASAQQMSREAVAMATQERERLKALSLALTAQRWRLLSELRVIYTIGVAQPAGGSAPNAAASASASTLPSVAADAKTFTILGIRLPNSFKNFTGCDEEKVAAGLGYVAHILHLVSRYLDVPLRFPVLPMCSRSVIFDEISSPDPLGSTGSIGGMSGLPSNVALMHSISADSAQQRYPLYPHGVDAKRFYRGVYYLNRNLEQLLDARGLEMITLHHTLPNLQILLGVPPPSLSSPSTARRGRGIAASAFSPQPETAPTGASPPTPLSMSAGAVRMLVKTGSSSSLLARKDTEMGAMRVSASTSELDRVVPSPTPYSPSLNGDGPALGIGVNDMHQLINDSASKASCEDERPMRRGTLTSQIESTSIQSDLSTIGQCETNEGNATNNKPEQSSDSDEEQEERPVKSKSVQRGRSSSLK